MGNFGLKTSLGGERSRSGGLRVLEEAMAFVGMVGVTVQMKGRAEDAKSIGGT